MKNRTKKDLNNNYLNLLALGFIFSSLLLIFFSINEPKNLTPGETELSSFQGNLGNTIVNKHLLKTTEDLEFQKLKTQVENFKVLKSFDETKSEKPKYSEKDNFFDFDGDPRVRQIAEDLGRANDVKAINNKDPKSRVYQSMFDEKRNKAIAYKEKVAAAKKFISDARKDGWEVEIDKDFKIKSYNKIGSPSEEEQENKKFEGYELFPNK